jgi:microcystin-dependent protein
MPLSRLENFLKNAEGNILYVNPSDFDATDSFENQGNSLSRPFKTIQRALIEAARFSYQQGQNNDRIDRTTILVYPGTHYIDNRPGYSIEEINGTAVYKRKVSPTTWQETTLDQFGLSTNFDVLDPNNDLYKYNSVLGGAILPRGTSIIGLDLRKTKIRPLFVPNPEDNTVDSTSIFNVTGTCYFTAFSIFDGDLTKSVFRDYTSAKVVPNYSHHKLTAFEYADGVNNVKLGNYQTYITDLDMYYYKVARAYGDITGRGLVDFPIGNDFEPSVDEFRIVGSLDPNPLGISSIRAGNGDGTGELNVITVTTSNKQTGETVPHNLFVDSPFLINGVTIDSNSYNGSFTVKEIVGINTFTFVTNSAPTEYLPNTNEIDTASLTIGSDTVSSASPYIFNCSLRSVFGLNGLHADGNKATGFKSIVVAQYTGVSLQKDNNAFILYDDGIFYDETTLPANSLEKPLHTNSRAIYKPSYENYHIKASNNAFIQAVSVFAIGFARHFLTESGADMSITNSNSNFGNTSLESVGFKPESFDRDDTGYITHIIPPREVVVEENEVTWLSLDSLKIINSVSADKLYLYGANNVEIVPAFQVDGYRIGARDNDKLYLTITIGTAQTTYSSPVLMPVSGGVGTSAKKEYEVTRINGQNNIVNNILSFTTNHQLINGEKIRIVSDTGQTPDGVENEGIYYAITTGIGANQIKLAQSLNDAIANIPILGLSNTGGVLTVVSRVSDKLPGEIGHPIQFDESENNWYVTGSTNPTQNEIYSAIVGIGTVVIGTETSSTFIKRKLDNRSIDDKIYKIRYVIPKDYESAKQPEAGYVIQESKTVGVTSISYTNDPLLSSKDLRNERVIIDASAGTVINYNQVVTITTELPHGLIAGDTVKIQKVRSTNNPNATGIVSSYNGIYSVESILSSKQFQYTISGVSTNPGTFSNDINARNTRQQREALPVFSRDSYKNTYFIYRVSQIKRHIPGADGQDGIYHLICLSSNVAPTSNVGFGLNKKQFNQDVKNLYPQLDRDNFDTNPKASVSYAELQTLGKIVTSDKRHSITREALNYFAKNSKVGYGLTYVALSGVGNTTITVNTDVQHNLNSIKSITFTSGSGYPASQTLYSKQLFPVISSGNGATVKVTTDPSGNISNVELLDPGSSYRVNDTLSIPGGSTASVVTVTAINDNSNSVIELNGFPQEELNNAFKIISIPDSNSVVLGAPTGISTYEPNTNGELPYLVVSGESCGITSSVISDVRTGIITYTTASPHGLLPGNKVRIVQTGSNILNGEFVVREAVGINTFSVVSYGLTQTAYSSSGVVLRRTLSPNARNIGRGEENLGSRGSTIYDKITVYTNQLFDGNSNTISFTDPTAVRRGDYYQVNSEIIRIASSSNPFTVLRGQFGTFKTTAPIGSAARKIKILPVEVRRPSFMRASGHTFEYLGFGPGNYSTGMPQRQNRILSEDEVLTSQAKEQRGGSVVYTGMNDLGEFFSGSKKLSSATGEESVIEAPILTYTGDDSQGESATVSSGIFDELLVRQRLTVEGGENNNQASQFYGPVNFTQKVTNLSDFGIETKNLLLKGTAAQSKLITVGISTPTSLTLSAPRSGDISLLSNPSSYIGHVRVNNEWRPFGVISRQPDTLDVRVDKLHVNTVADSSFNFEVRGESKVQNLIVDGQVVFTQPQSLGNVTFQNATVQRTAIFTGTGLDPISGLTSSYTQIHLAGISLLNDLEVTGISTFAGRVDFNSNIFGIGAKFGNIRIGVRDDNTIDTVIGDLTIDSDSGTTRIIDNLVVDGNKIELNTGNSVSIGGTITTRINNSRVFDIGIGNTDGSTSVILHGDDRTYQNGGLVIRKNDLASGEGTDIIHRGLSKLNINAFDAGGQVSILTSNIERVLVGSSGTVTVFQNNSGTELKGNHFKLTQAGSGDVVMSWDITNNNANRRWYAGIDASDSYAWKLANPEATLAYGLENFENPLETKLRIASNGDTTIAGTLTLGGNSLATVSPTFSLLNNNAVIINAFQAATTLSMGSNAANATVTIRGTTQSNSTGTGALVVGGGVGIAGNLYVGGYHGNTSIQGTLSATGDTTLGGTLSLASNAAIGGNLRVAGITTITQGLLVGGDFDLTGSADADGDIFGRSFIKKNPGAPTNFLRANGTDSILTGQDFINSLGFIPGPPITVSTYPVGNSIILDDISGAFDGTTITFNLTRDGGTPFVPVGPINLIVSLGGVIQKGNTDYLIPTNVDGAYTSTIRFTTAPSAGLGCFIIALGGQGALLSDPAWDRKGQIPIGIRDNTAVMQEVGANGTVLTADSSSQTGVGWKSIPPGVPTGSVFYFATAAAPDGYLVCNGDLVPNGTGTVQGVTANFAPLYTMLATTYGAAGKLPDLRNYFTAGSGNSYPIGSTGGANTVSLTTDQLPSHSHSANSSDAGGHSHAGSSTSNAGDHTHSGSSTSAGDHSHSGSSSSAGDHSHSGSTSSAGSHNHNYQRPSDKSSTQPGGGPGKWTSTNGDGTGNAGDHSHSMSLNPAGNHSHTMSLNPGGSHSHNMSLNPSGGHSHSVSIDAVTGHTHTITVSSTGSGSAHENRPPYVALLPVIKY